MPLSEFDYYTITKDDSSAIGSMIACRYSEERLLQAVMWHGWRKRWLYAPGVAGGFLDDLDYVGRTVLVTRGDAEVAARESLGTELPTEQRLGELCEEGARMGWRFGPPLDEDELPKFVWHFRSGETRDNLGTAFFVDSRIYGTPVEAEVVVEVATQALTELGVLFEIERLSVDAISHTDTRPRWEEFKRGLPRQPSDD